MGIYTIILDFPPASSKLYPAFTAPLSIGILHQKINLEGAADRKLNSVFSSEKCKEPLVSCPLLPEPTEIGLNLFLFDNYITRNFQIESIPQELK